MLDSKTILLQELARRPGCGLELIERIRELSGGRIVLFQGAVYPALKALETAELVKSHTEQRSGRASGRPKRIYEITNAGLRTVRTDRRTIAHLFELDLRGLHGEANDLRGAASSETTGGTVSRGPSPRAYRRKPTPPSS